MQKLIKQSLFAEVLNEMLEKLHSEITSSIFMHDDLHFSMSESQYDLDSPKKYEDNYIRVMSATDPKCKTYPELKEYVDAELAKFTGKVMDKNDGETQSTMSGLTKKSAIKGAANALADKAKREVGDSPPPKARTGKVAFDESPDIDRADLKDLQADDPKRRTDGIDRILGGNMEGMDIAGGAASLDDLSKANTRALR